MSRSMPRRQMHNVWTQNLGAVQPRIRQQISQNNVETDLLLHTTRRDRQPTAARGCPRIFLLTARRWMHTALWARFLRDLSNPAFCNNLSRQCRITRSAANLSESSSTRCCANKLSEGHAPISCAAGCDRPTDESRSRKQQMLMPSTGLAGSRRAPSRQVCKGQAVGPLRLKLFAHEGHPQPSFEHSENVVPSAMFLPFGTDSKHGRSLPERSMTQAIPFFFQYRRNGDKRH